MGNLLSKTIDVMRMRVAGGLLRYRRSRISNFQEVCYMATETQQIEPKNWEHFFNDFSRAHQGDVALMREVDADVGDQVQASSRSFVGISSDVKGSEPGSISIILGSESDDNLERTISKPTRVYMHEGRVGSGMTSLQIEQQEGPRLILELKALPAIQEEA
jgi:hypothetical protein